MSIEVDKVAAMRILNLSVERCSVRRVRTCPIKDAIDFVMHGAKCLTYQYILFTALLAKATDSSVDILSLQAGDGSSGAYDARGLAKDVVYRFQMSRLGNVLDGSNNDPLVNKPGRFQRLDVGNAVAKGDPQRALEMLCRYLPLVESSGEALVCVDYIVSMLLDEKERRDCLRAEFSGVALGVGPYRLRSFMSDLLDQGFGGSALVIVATALYRMMFSGDRYRVVPHSTNQPGDSKRQFSDLDLLLDGSPFMGTELKDKPFTASDVAHAAETAAAAGASSLMFVAGRQSNFASQPPTYYAETRDRYAASGLYVGVMSIDMLMDWAFATSPATDPAAVLDVISETAERIGALEAQLWVYDRKNLHG